MADEPLVVVGPASLRAGPRAAARVLGWGLRLLFASLRRRWVGRHRLEALRARGEPFVFASWHGRSALLAPAMRDVGPTILVSGSRDGAWATAVLQGLGYGVVRGSASGGGARGLRGLLRATRSGTPVAVTVDGPRGPGGHVAPGVVALAQVGDVWIVPVAAACRRGWTLRTWDRTRVPAPGSTAVVLVGRPVKAARTADRDEVVAALEARLRSLHRAADRLVRQRS